MKALLLLSAGPEGCCLLTLNAAVCWPQGLLSAGDQGCCLMAMGAVVCWPRGLPHLCCVRLCNTGASYTGKHMPPALQQDSFCKLDYYNPLQNPLRGCFECKTGAAKNINQP